MNSSQWISKSNPNWIMYSSQQDPVFLCAILDNPYKAPKDIDKAFAYVVVHQHSDEIIAARDPFGLEPLYYYYDSKQFIFGSNIPDIINSLQQQPKINSSQIIDLFTDGLNGRTLYTNETPYQNIYRVEPGHILRIKAGQIKKTVFWQLDKEASTLQLKNDDAYLEHFSALMSEALQPYKNDEKLAAEFSGGLDSSAIVLAAQQIGISPALFTHIAPFNSAENDDREYADSVISHLKLNPYSAIDAESFDPLKVFQYCAQRFAGAPPHLFYMLANNIHQAVSQQGYTTLLSGFGGDECVSGHAPLRAYLPELIKQHRYQKAWQELLLAYQSTQQIPPSKIKRCILLLKSAHPYLYSFLSQIETLDHTIACYLKLKNSTQHSQQKFYHSIRDYEYDLLQGPRSHHLRMRIEYSAVIAKSIGFKYRYPLLYPKLVEFYFRLPSEQKRRNGINRYLIRRYLAQFLPEKIYNKHQKTGAIMPATMKKCRDYYAQGLFNFDIKKMPFLQHINKNTNDFHKMIATIYSYMFGIYLNDATFKQNDRHSS